jgi:hypothetical protein
MNKLEEVIKILNDHYNYLFAYNYKTLENGENMLFIFKTDLIKQADTIKVIELRTFGTKEELFQHAYESFIKYIAFSKEIFRRKEFEGDTYI